MAWTSPRTWVTSEVVTAALLNAHVRDNMLMAAGASKPAASVVRTAAQSIPNNLLTAISFDTETYDTDTMFAATSTNVTVKTAGLWMLTGLGSFVAAASSRRLVRICVNGSGVLRTEGPATAGVISIPVSGQVRLAVNDVLTLEQFQNSGGAVNTDATGTEFRPQLQATWLGA